MLLISVLNSNSASDLLAIQVCDFTDCSQTLLVEHADLSVRTVTENQFLSLVHQVQFRQHKRHVLWHTIGRLHLH